MLAKKWWWILIAGILLTGCAKPIVIGFVDTMSGYEGKKAKEFMQAAQIAIDEKNKQGGIGGKKLVLKAIDIEGNQNKALQAMDNLIKQNAVAVIGLPILAEKAQNAKIPLLIVNSRDKVPTPTTDYIFRNVLSYEREAEIFGKYVYNVMGVKKIAIISVTNSYATQVLEKFKKSFTEEGGVIAAEQYIREITDPYSDEYYFEDELKAIKGKADVIFIPNPPVENQRILITADELGMKVRFISTSIFGDREVFNEARTLANGVYFSSIPENLEEVTPARANYEKAYKEKYGDIPSYESINSYDGTKLLIYAIEGAYEKDSDKVNTEKMKDILLNIKDFEGTMFKLSMLPNGEVNREVGIFKSEHMGFVQQEVYMFRDGKLEHIR